MSFAWNQLRLAVHELVGSGTQRQRLSTAYDAHLSHLKKRDCPKEIQRIFLAMVADINCDKHFVPMRFSDVHRISDERIYSIINEIVDMYDVVTRYEPLLAKEDQGIPRNPPAGMVERRKCNFKL